MKRIIIAITCILLTFIITTIVGSYLILNSSSFLKNFNIKSVENISTKYTIDFEKVKAAKYYEIVVYDEDNHILYKNNTTKTVNTIDLNKIEYDKKYRMVVFAYDKVGDSLGVNNPYTFTYTEPTFDSGNSLVLINNEEYNLLINGDLTRKKYRIGIYIGKEKLKEEPLTTNEYKIDESLYNNVTGVLTINLYENNEVINTIDLYSNVSPVKDLVIKTPSNGDILDYNDVTFTYEGGDNATKYLLQIYKDKNLIKEQTISKNRCVISSGFFSKAESYKIKINALYDDYTDFTKTAEVAFAMNEKDTLKPAYINYNPKYVTRETEIILSNPNQDGKIFYTIDGSDPAKNGLEYSSPIIANDNMTIKTIIKEEKKNDSIISTFDINIGQKKQYAVYLSPSNQHKNLGVKEVGYTNERDEMNDLSNYIAARLKEKGIKVYRNNPNGNINLWTSDSRYYGVDLHLAIHSNASTNHDVFGIETWIDEQGNAPYSLANMIQNNLMKIYYHQDGTGNRGVKYANGSLGEVNDLVVPFGILVEVAHHDYKDDAAWIMTNKALIGNTIADTVIKYFGIN